MTKEEFIAFLDRENIPYVETNLGSIDQVYVFERKSYDLKKDNPRRYKDLYVPYFRVSNFGEKLYTRDNGWCEYMSDKDVIKKCRELGA